MEYYHSIFHHCKLESCYDAIFEAKIFLFPFKFISSILISKHNASIGNALGAQHRAYMKNITNDNDIFVYHEDDILFTLLYLNGYLYESKKLHELLPENGLWDHSIGFQGYRRRFRNNDIHLKFTEQDIFEQELLEETPEFVPICIKNQPYIRVHGNTHQAIWILTRQQVLMFQEKCNFLNQNSSSR